MFNRFALLVSSLRPAAVAGVALLVSGLAGGCGSSSAAPAGVTLACQSSGTVYRQAFGVGVADVRDAGDTDVVVTCRTEPSAQAVGAHAAAPAVTQVLHVHMLWQQGFKVKAAMQEVSQNASLHWCVYPAGRSDGGGNAGKPQVVEYTGTGLVELSRDGNLVTLRVADAKLTPTTVSPRMADPIGPATLNGTLVARADRRETVAMLNDLRATGAAGRSVASVPVAGGVPTGPAAAEAKLPVGQ